MSRPARPPRRDDSRKAAGSLTGSRRLRAEGRAGRFKGNLKQTGAKVKDAVKH